MQKILFICALFIFGLTTQVNAQGRDKWVELPSISFGTSATSGAQTIVVPGGKGTLKFDKTGDRFTNVVFLDSLGKTHRLSPVKPGTGGAPQPSCKFPLPDACFATSDKNIGMCICKPTDLAGSANGEYLIGLLLPAVQKVREAAAKTRN